MGVRILQQKAESIVARIFPELRSSKKARREETWIVHLLPPPLRVQTPLRFDAHDMQHASTAIEMSALSTSLVSASFRLERPYP